MSETNRTQSTVARVSARWQECAVHVRGELRQYGVRGELRRLDDYASRERGTGIARFLSEFVAYCHERGMSPDRIAEHLHEFTDLAVADVVTPRAS